MAKRGRKVAETYTVDEVAKVLGIGRNQGYEAIRANEIPHFRIGKRIIIPKAAIKRMLNPETAK